MEDDDRIQLPRLQLFMVGGLAVGGGILFGYDMGIISGALPQLEIYFNLSCFQQEMVVSTMLIGALFGSLIGGSLIDKFGRKTSILFSILLFFVGALVIAFTTSYSLLIVGRIILGFAMSVSATAECIYISEIAPCAVRGSLISFNELGITVGILFSYVINLAFAHDVITGWRYMFGLSCLGALFVLIFIILLPQSPRFLIMQQRIDEARESLFQVRKLESMVVRNLVEDEFNSMISNSRIEINLISIRSKKKLFYPLFVGMGLVFFQQSTGQPNILFYASKILIAMGFDSAESADLGAISLGVSKVIATVICLTIVDKFKRKSFLMVGSISMLIILLSLVMVTFNSELDPGVVCSDNATDIMNISLTSSNSSLSDDSYPENGTNKWMALIFLILFIAAFSMSFGPLTWIILSEIFPTDMRGRLFALATSLNWIINLILSATFLRFAKETRGLTGPFLLNCSMSIISVFFVYLCVPETKGKTLEEVNNIMDQSNILSSKHTCSEIMCCSPERESQVPLLVFTNSPTL